MSEETNAAVQQLEPEKPVNEPETPTEQAVIEPETPPEPTEAAVPAEEPPADEAAASEPTAEKTDASAAEIAELKGKVHALTAGAKPDSLGDLLTLAGELADNVKTLAAVGGTVTASVTAVGTKVITFANDIDKSAKIIYSASGELLDK